VRRPPPLLLAALLALLAAAPARATTFVATSVEEIARGADAVVRGKVVSASSRWEGKRIVTDVAIAVSEAWKGAPGRRVVLTVRGGTVGRIAQRVDAAAAFTVGEEVVVFASRARGGAGWRVGHAALGKYRVEDGRVRPGTEGARFEPRPIAPGERLVEEMSVEELERRVRSAG
jgi:hypothetical protein